MKWLLALVVFALAGCVENSSVVFLDIETPAGTESFAVKFDDATFPSESLYADVSDNHPGQFSVHDLMLAWGENRIDTSHYEGLGFSLNSVDGLANDLENFCYFWTLQLNGESTETGMSTTTIQHGDVVTWTYQFFPGCLDVTMRIVDNGTLLQSGTISLVPDVYDSASLRSDHPGHHTAYDVLATWGGDFQVTQSDSGAWVTRLAGTTSNLSEDACKYWSLQLNDNEVDVGDLDVQIHGYDVLAWNLAGC